MPHRNHSRVKVAVFADHHPMGEKLRQSLASRGFTDTVVFDSADQLDQAVRTSDIDLLISQSVSGPRFLGNMVREIRHGRSGKHPFPIVMMLAYDADGRHVKSILDSGVDDLLLEPQSAEGVVNRALSFMSSRRPYVVTYEYIGPDRRRDSRTEEPSAPVVDAPNPIQLKLSGIGDARIQALLAEAAQVVSRCKIERNGIQLSWLIERLKEEMQLPKRRHEAIRGLLWKIDETATDISRRAQATSDTALRERAGNVSAAARAIGGSPDIAQDPRLDELIEMTADSPTNGLV